jgi:hypothetical protein
MAEAKQNYTEEMVAQAVELYEQLGNEGMEEIAEAIGRSVRSVRSKLVREGVYVATPKAVKAKVDTGPTKKQLLNDLEALVDFDVTGLMGATKAAITSLIEAFTPAEVETESEVDEAA